MSVFGNLMDRIRGHAARKEAAKENEGLQATAAANPQPTPAPAAAPASPAASAPAAAPVNVEAVLEGLAADSKQKLDWRHSIVDLMKLVGMESSLAERKDLAAELGYTGDTGDSAAMNTWLHAQVMQKMRENGGQLPGSMTTDKY